MFCLVVQIVLIPFTPLARMSTHFIAKPLTVMLEVVTLSPASPAVKAKVEEGDPVRRGVEPDELVLGQRLDPAEFLAGPARAGRGPAARVLALVVADQVQVAGAARITGGCLRERHVLGRLDGVGDDGRVAAGVS